MQYPTIHAIGLPLAATLVALFSAKSAIAQDSLSKDLELLTDLMARPLAQRALQWVCVPSVRYVCTSKGCERSPATVSVQIDFAKKTYSRCDTKGCDTYPLTSQAGGIFTTVNLPGRGATFLKVVNDGSEYVEVASLNLAVQQNFGACQPSK